MATNRIIQSINLATIEKSAQKFVLELATETQNWKRVASVVDQNKYKEIVQKSDTALPAGTKRAIVR